MSKERLTKRNESNTAYYFPLCFEKCDGIGASRKCDRCELVDNACNKLGEYEELEEQGLLLRLPCKVGDTVYIIDKRHTKCSVYDEEYNESSCSGCECECDSNDYYVVVKRYIGTIEWIVSRIKEFGKTVFLTQSEAEEKLRESNKESEEYPMNCVCGNCKHNKRDFSKPQNSGYAEFCCGNEDSDNYGVPTMYDDSCDDFEEKE